VLRDEPRLKRPRAIARHRNRQRPVVRQHRLAARAIAMIGRVFRLGPAARIPEMVAELATEGALNDGLLKFLTPSKAPSGGVMSTTIKQSLNPCNPCNPCSPVPQCNLRTNQCNPRASPRNLQRRCSSHHRSNTINGNNVCA
jgi:hypothetical protein